MVSDEALKKLQEQIAAWPMTQRFVVQQLVLDYLRDREDLRAYEATRLTPEQCENAKSIIESAFSDDTSKAERIRELLKADKDGRLVVLPCKVGDTLWVTRNPWTGKLLKKPLDAYVNGMKMYSHGLYVNLLFDTRKINGSRDYEINHIGKTVFFTREEAEKELKTKEGSYAAW